MWCLIVSFLFFALFLALKSTGKGNLYLGPLHIIDRILEYDFLIPCDCMTSGLIAILRVFTSSRVRNINFNIKSCYSFVIVKISTANRFIVLITNDRGFHIPGSGVVLD